MPPDEISFFEDPDYHRSTVTDLAAMFTNSGDGAVLGMKRPNYLYKSEVPARIKKVLKKPKIIAIIRDPIERLLSSYFHNIRYGFVPLLEAEKGLCDLLDGRLQKTYPRAHEVLDFSFYYPGLKKYYELFEKSNVLVLSYEALKTNPRDFVRSAYKFLGIDESFLPARNIGLRPQAVLYSLPRLRILTLTNRLQFAYSHEKDRVFGKKNDSYLGQLTVGLIKSLDKNFLRYIFPSKKPLLSPGLQTRLVNLYHKDIYNTQKLTGLNFSFAGKYINNSQPL